MSLAKLWVEQYRPSDVEDYLFQDSAQKSAFLKMIINQSIPHLLLSGIQGTGKTSLALLLIQELGIDECDILTINVSDERSVDVVRDKMMPFITSFAIGQYKVILLEEADEMTPTAQRALKFVLEEYADVVRFIFTCNHEQKIIPPIKSRLQQFRFKSHNRKQVVELLSNILTSEKVKFDTEHLDKYVAICYPDIRKTINLLQQNSMTGTLIAPQAVSENSDFKSKLLEGIEKDAWYDMVDSVIPNITNDEWDDMYRFVYENLSSGEKFKGEVANMKQAVVLIAEYMYRHTLCADPAINAAALFIRLSEI